MARACRWAGLGVWAALAGSALAQSEPPEPVPSEPLERDAAAAPAQGEGEGAQEINPDEMSNILNARQKIKQRYTVTRTIDGEVVESEQRELTVSPGQPVRPTEAGKSALQALSEAFDREVLTRTEAYEEARLSFTVADANRDNLMNADEFIALVNTWRNEETDTLEARDSGDQSQRDYLAFIEELEREQADKEAAANARQKFLFMAGAALSISRDDFIREYLLDFDTMDANKDQLLRDAELAAFRALKRGEAVESD